MHLFAVRKVHPHCTAPKIIIRMLHIGLCSQYGECCLSSHYIPWNYLKTHMMTTHT
jgi:hypothetical protein